VPWLFKITAGEVEHSYGYSRGRNFSKLEATAATEELLVYHL